MPGFFKKMFGAAYYKDASFTLKSSIVREVWETLQTTFFCEALSQR